MNTSNYFIYLFYNIFIKFSSFDFYINLFYSRARLHTRVYKVGLKICF